MNDHKDAGDGASPANLILVEQSGVKREIAQPSAVSAMIEAEQAMRRSNLNLREIKLVSHKKALARWKAGEQGWRRVA